MIGTINVPMKTEFKNTRLKNFLAFKVGNSGMIKFVNWASFN